MKVRLDTTGEALRSPIPWVAVSAAVVLTAVAWFALERSRYDEARLQFERRTETATSAVRARMLTYEQILRGAAAHMASEKEVTREGWRRFIAHMQLDERFPGIQSVGYAEHLSRVSLPEHVRRMQEEGFKDYQVTPAPEDRETFAVVLYNEPRNDHNTREIGADYYAEPVRRAAIEKARETGEPAVTGRVLLASGQSRVTQAAEQPGFVMFVPLFHGGREDLPRSERANAVAGYVFSALRMHDLMQGVLDQGTLQVIDMRVYDQAEGRAAQNELIDTRTAWRSAPASAKPVFERVAHFPMPGRSWTIQFVSRPEFDVALRGDRPWLVLLGGGLASAVMFLLMVALVDAWNRAHHLSMRDPLTGLFNRRYLEETMPRELARATRSEQSVGVIVLDLDHFKKLNDTHGHGVGDLVLQRVGELLMHASRGDDIACRMGGEEFALILPASTPEGAQYRAESIRAAFANINFDYEGLKVGPFTLSAGVAMVPPGAGDWVQGMRQADRALYAAKQGGRNRVVVAPEGKKKG
jgi:diguanylate cyclase (GGDEF)-like protein